MSSKQHRIYQLDGFAIDTSRLCLIQNGHTQHLRQKPFQVLLYLVEHRQQVVTKEELLDNIWSDVTVTDNVVEHCLAEIRKALGDDSRQPRFIKTIPRGGYRLIAPVDERFIDHGGDEEIASGANIESKQANIEARSNDAVAVHRKHGLSISPRSLLVLAAIILIGGGGTLFYSFRSGPSPSSSPNVRLPTDAGKRAVAVMFFDNASNSPELDWLREGLADMVITDLARSNGLAVLSRQQLRMLLDRVGHNQSEKIRLDEALDLAHKSQAQLVILGSFARLGEEIRIDVQIHDARDGQLLTAERLIVDKPDQILTQVDLLSLKLASHLGATAQSESTASLTSVMTNNLEAYRYYSLGVERAQAMQNPEAISLLEKAAALDSQFAMAYARIGYIYAVTWGIQHERAKPYLEKAFQLSSRLTEKDKLYIAGWFAIANLDFGSAIESFRRIISRFPLEVEAYRRLGLLLQGEERFDEAIAIMKQGLVIDSGNKDLYNSLGGIYLDLGQEDEAIATFQHYVQLAPQEANAHDSLASAYQVAGRYDDAVAEYQQALALKPDFEIALVHLGNAYFQEGRYREAIEQYRHYIQSAPSDSERSRGYNSIAYVDLRRGEMNKAQQAARTAIKYDQNAFSESFLIALERGDLPAAGKFKQQLELNVDNERGRRGTQRPVLYFRAALDLKEGKTDEALHEFKESLSHRAQYWVMDTHEDCLADAYLKASHPDEAIAEYERILKFNPNYPLAHYHLARAFEHKGSREQARVEYERFLQVWKNADADVPEVIKARSLSTN